MNRCLCCGKPLEEGVWHKNCIKRFFGVDQLPIIFLDKENLENTAIRQLNDGKTVAGVQEKLSLHLDLSETRRPRMTVIGYPSGYILKPQSSEYKQLPEFEHTAMLLADLCSIKTVPHALIPLENGELAYITKRIDRDGEKKIHLEDFCQASGLTTALKYRSSYERCAELIKANSKTPLLDLTTFFKVLYFSFVIGNSDMHLKNFSFIMDESGALRLAPAYDLLPTKAILLSDHEDLGLTMNEKKMNLRSHDFIAFCQNVGIPESAMRKMMMSIDAKVEEMEAIIEASSIHQNGKSEWVKMIHHNILRAKKP